MIGKMIQKIKKESGAVQIVEAAFVFPVMFIILFFLIYMGNAHYIKAQIHSVVTQGAIDGAAYCADPVLSTIRAEGKVPSLSELNVDPYRYFSGMDSVEAQIREQVIKGIEGNTSSLFSNMTPKIKTSRSNIAKYTNYILYSTFSVEVKCEVGFPIRFLGKATPVFLTINSRAEIAVNDTAEFIRNTDMAIDYFVDTKFGQTIQGIFEKINSVILKFANS